MKVRIYVISIIIIFCFFDPDLNGQVLKQEANKNTSNVQQKSKDAAEASVSKSLSNSGKFISVKTGAVLKVGITSASVSGRILTDNLADVVSTGICWNTKPRPVISNFKLSVHLDSARFICQLNNLTPATIYFLRAFATTATDTVYGDQVVFYTHKQGAVADIEGNYYNSIVIGTQTWLTEDLKTSLFNNGLPITNAAGTDSWLWRKTPAWCWYSNDSANYSFPRGKLYNWYAVETGKLCPTGWHVPSNSEWTTLQNFLGGDTIAGGKLKTTGTFFWRSPNARATDQSGFSAIPGGYRSASGKFFYFTIVDNWWSTDIISPDAAYNWHVNHESGRLYHEYSFKSFGYCVRCLKDK
jgi:uncharacterized protein (TIGR02145 family)